MNPVSTFKDFHRFLRTTFPDAGFPAHPEWDTEIAAFGETYLPHVMSIIQKTDSFFDESRFVFGVDVEPLWSDPESPRDEIWKFFQSCLISSFLSGDIKSKLGKVLESVKGLWAGNGQSTDAIDKILNDDESQSKISEILEFLMTTRIATLAKSVLESVDISELGISLESPEQLMEIIRDPSHPAIKAVMTKVQAILEEKMRKGEFTREILIHEVELIKTKLTDAFGSVVGEMMGFGTRGDNTPAEVILSNHPDARRARMLARLQRKQKERGRKTSQ